MTDLRAARELGDEVTFVGGEPTQHPELPTFIGEARRLGFARIGLQTNARRAQALPVLAAAGLTDVHLSIHGDTAAAHEYHTGVEGSFSRSFAAVAVARAASLQVVVTTVLTRSNARNLAGLAQLLASRGVTAWSVSVPRARGRAALLFDRVVPRLGVTIPFVLHALQVAEAARLPAFVRGAPLCLLGRFATRALPTEARAYGEACTECEVRGRCPGVEPEYLARFAGDELRAGDAPPSGAAGAHARMFVGEGVLAPPRGAPMPESPVHARRALPVLGKVRPAEKEVPRAADRKTGEALREIFTELFDDPTTGRG